MADTLPPVRGHRIRNTQAKGGRIDVADIDRNKQNTENLEEIKIDGRIYKPSVFYVLARSNIIWGGLEIPQNFTSRIFRDAMRRPF